MNFSNSPQDLSQNLKRSCSELPDKNGDKTENLCHLVDKSMRDPNFDFEDENYFKVFARIRKNPDISYENQNIVFKLDEKSVRANTI
jgi:hypothetical protein